MARWQQQGQLHSFSSSSQVEKKREREREYLLHIVKDKILRLTPIEPDWLS